MTRALCAASSEMASAFPVAMDDERDAHRPVVADDSDDDDAALRVTLAFVDEFPASPPSSSVVFAASPSPQLPSLIATSEPVEADQRLHHSNCDVYTRHAHTPHLHLHEPATDNIYSHITISRSSSSSNRETQPLTKKRVSSVSNKARDGRKEELIYLRKKVVELEHKLAERKRKTTSDLEPPTGTVGSSQPLPSVARIRHTNKKSPGAVPSVWEEIVTRQYNQRVKAERENIRLKVVLENQVKIARSLEKVLQKTTCTKDFEKLIHGKSLPYLSRSSSLPQSSVDSRLFQELLAGLDQSYAEAEGMFQASRVARVETSYIDAVVRSDDSHGIQLEVVASKVLPFDMRTAGSVVWRHYVFAKERLPNRAYHHNSPQALSATEDTIIEDFNLEVDINSAIALFQAKLVMRRYSEEDRIVIVWRAFFDPQCIADEPTPGVRFLEKGYVVINRSDSVDSSATMVSSSNNVLQTCYIATPVATGDLAGADRATVGAITDFMLSATASNISSSHEMIENVLLEHASKSSFGI
ncbi:hypothetical protein Gpo141_00003764 [Globisporangium polare]